MLCSLSAERSLAQSSEGVVVATANIVAPPSASAGTAMAGLLCLPSGRLRIAHFVAGEGDLLSQAQAAFAAADRPSLGGGGQAPAKLSISLEGVEASLCARKYGTFGLGDRRSLSGRAEFRFSWSAIRAGENAPARTELVRLEVPKAQARPIEALLADALAVLARKVLNALGSSQL